MTDVSDSPSLVPAEQAPGQRGPTTPSSTTAVTPVEPSAPEPSEADAAASPPDGSTAPDPNTYGGTTSSSLESLTPTYDPERHGTYLRHLEEAIKDPQNLNIALTGRYGTGKSSVLDAFEASNRPVTQRLAISTLAPGAPGESTTNRIQKEIVKHLVYGASQKVGKNSRFAKIAVLPKVRAFVESAVLVAVVGALLYLFGWLPDIKWTGADETTLVRWSAWLGTAALATVAVTLIRLVTYGRFLSNVSAAGAAMTLSDKPDSFFDKFLDEIVHYFDSESKDIVIFEDLDRFEDPHIFEALRELNLLLNETPKRRRMRRGNRFGRLISRVLLKWPRGSRWRTVLVARLSPRWANLLFGVGVPLRFVYAVKDSVFAKIGPAGAQAPASRDEEEAGSEEEKTPAGASESPVPVDAAAAETLRANRTKFFDLVIPIVPFISHRNARDLLGPLLKERGITGIEPRLINTVAHHCTDMRLMRNMCNEYLVFAERLLEPTDPATLAPGLNESRLFALVVYKNFHLEDFENITRHDSYLDRVYEHHRKIVQDSITALDARKRLLLTEPERVRSREATAVMLGKRLKTLGEHMRLASRYSQYGLNFTVGSTDYRASEVESYEFWEQVAHHQEIHLRSGGHQLPVLNADVLHSVLLEGMDADQWVTRDQTAAGVELQRIDDAVDALRRADFADLIVRPEFTTPANPQAMADATGTTHSPEAGQSTGESFADLVTQELPSELARDLVRRGYIDRNFSLYAAQFYGHFTGVDVANYMVQHIQTQVTDIHYDLSRQGAVANLLHEAEEAGVELLDTVAVYNIDIVNHLMTTPGDRGLKFALNLIHSGPDLLAQVFLDAYFTSERAEREQLTSYLTGLRWAGIFAYVVTDKAVPSTARSSLLSVALRNFRPASHISPDEAVRSYIETHYRHIPALTHEPDENTPHAADAVRDNVATAIDHFGVSIPDISTIGDPKLRTRIVDAGCYDLTADNLRVALGVTGAIPLDVVANNPQVYRRCLKHLPQYLKAVEEDVETDHAVDTEDSLCKALHDIVKNLDDPDRDTREEVAGLLAQTSPAARVSDLSQAPQSAWAALAEFHLFVPSLANVDSYRIAFDGDIDTPLASLLNAADAIDTSSLNATTDWDHNEIDPVPLAVAILNAPQGLTPEKRVQLVTGLDLAVSLPADEITSDRNLFALLLEAGAVPDDAATFDQVCRGGAAAIVPAIKRSNDIASFLTPNHIEHRVAEVLADKEAAAKAGTVIMHDVASYVVEEDVASAEAVVAYADTHKVQLTPDAVKHLVRIGQAQQRTNPERILRLLSNATPAPMPDDVVDVFTALGAPYSAVSNRGDTFELDINEPLERLLQTLKTGGVVSLSALRRPRPSSKTGSKRRSITVL